MGQATRACLLLVAGAVAAAAVLHVVCLFADCSGGRQPLAQGVAASAGANPRLRTAGGATTRRAPRPTLIPVDEDDDELTITCRRPLVFRKDGCHLPDAANSG